MKKKRTNYRQIESFKELNQEKLRLYYQVKYSEKKMQLKLLETGYLLHPTRLVPSLLSEWIRPLLSELRQKLIHLFRRKKEEDAHKSKEQ